MSIDVNSAATYVSAASVRTDLAEFNSLPLSSEYFFINPNPLLDASISIGTVTNANIVVLAKSIIPISAICKKFIINPSTINAYPSLDPMLTIVTNPVLILKSIELLNFCCTCPSSCIVTAISAIELLSEALCDSLTVSFLGSKWSESGSPWVITSTGRFSPSVTFKANSYAVGLLVVTLENLP